MVGGGERGVLVEGPALVAGPDRDVPGLPRLQPKGGNPATIPKPKGKVVPNGSQAELEFNASHRKPLGSVPLSGLFWM
jgi:hypothetical protein